MPGTIWTIGHSSRPWEEFARLLAGPAIELVADVRRSPASRRHPHFDREALAETLGGLGIGYVHLEGLGGRRGKPAPGSPNVGWRIESFNAFADALATPEGDAALLDLIGRAEQARTAVMCSEAIPWQCHRRLIADALTARGWMVLDIMGAGKLVPHRPTPFARVEGDRVTYPGRADEAPGSEVDNGLAGG